MLQLFLTLFTADDSGDINALMIGVTIAGIATLIIIVIIIIAIPCLMLNRMKRKFFLNSMYVAT